MAQQIHSGEGDNVAGNKNVQNTFTLTTKLLAIAVIIAAAALIFVPPLLPQPAPLHGYVVSSADKPLEGAMVTFTAAGQEPVTVFTNAEGAFVFEKLDAKKLGVFQLTAQVDARTVQDSTSGSVALTAPVVLKLPAGTPPFDLYYFALEGQRVADLIAGKIPLELEELGPKGSIIIPNEVFNILKNLKDEFVDIGDFLGFSGDVEDLPPNFPWITPIEPQQLAAQSAGDWYKGDKKISATEMQQMLAKADSLKKELRASDISWNEIYNEPDLIYEIPMFNVLSDLQEEISGFWKYIEPEVVQQMGENGQLPPIYPHLARNKMPSDFLKATFEKFGECGEPISTIRIRVVKPEASVKIVVLANNSDDPLEIDSFFIKANRENRLRTVKEDTTARHEAKVFEKKLFPRNRINPGEMLLIPLELHYVYETGDRKANQAQEYVFGPSWEIAGVEVGIEEYPFRRKRPEVLAFINSMAFGSCPYAFTYDERTKLWRMEDHIIANQNAPHKAGYDTISLSRFTGELIIRELDPEVSYLDYIEVLEVRENQETHSYLPDHDLLRKRDGQAFFMEQGDEIRLDFRPLAPPGKEEVQFLLVAYGYYVVNEVN